MKVGLGTRDKGRGGEGGDRCHQVDWVATDVKL